MIYNRTQKHERASDDNDKNRNCLYSLTNFYTRYRLLVSVMGVVLDLLDLKKILASVSSWF